MMFYIHRASKCQYTLRTPYCSELYAFAAASLNEGEFAPGMGMDEL
jgi:hypothetical protein